MPELQNLALVRIDEPALPIREAMDEGKLRELADNMAAIGLIQPICIKVVQDGAGFPVDPDAAALGAVPELPPERYEIVAGHRRYMAAKMLGWREILSIVYRSGELEALAAQLAENIYREDLTAAEEAIWFAELMEKNHADTDGLAALIHKTRDYVEDRLRLLTGDGEVFNALRRRDLVFSVARELNKCTDAGHRRMLLDVAVKGGHSARVVQQWIANWKAGAATASSAPVEPGDAQPVAPVPAFRQVCVLCDADHDPYNLEVAYVHKYCRAFLEKLITEAGMGARK
jgi:ParB family chromosome partitioning protein